MSAILNTVLIILCFQSSVLSWDLAVTVDGSIEFYHKNGTSEDIPSQQFNHLTALAYDSVFQSMYFTDTRHDNVTIFQMNEIGEIISVVRKRIGNSVQGIAYDPVSGILFWTDGNNRSIFWASLISRSEQVDLGRILIQMTEETPQGIAVDSCRRFLYWTNSNYLRPTIERSQLDGSKREVLIKDDLFMPLGITIDQVGGRMYWTDDKEGIYFKIESANLIGKDRKVLYHGIHQEPYNIAVGVDSVYWTDWVFKTIWSFPLDPINGTNPVSIIPFVGKGTPIGIIAKDNILNRITNKDTECNILQEALTNRTKMLEEQNLLKNEQEKNTLISRMETLTENYKFCLNGGVMNGDSKSFLCKCPHGFSGARCETSVCYNYCIEGSCVTNVDGSPICRCFPDYGGERCQQHLCDGYCLNGGKCTAKDHNPQCLCTENFMGERCEKSVQIPERSNASYNLSVPIALKEIEEYGYNNTSNNNGLMGTGSKSNAFDGNSQCFDFIHDPIMVTLAGTCIALTATCVYLAHKVLELKKRPRIRKRIIVNKNVTPLTSRPEPRTQCEITIENCCNMNICETPCFEPQGMRTNINVELNKKDEKKNLLMNMENHEY